MEYLSRQYTPARKTYAATDPVAGTITIWTPVAGKKVGITDIVVSNTLAGTIAFYFESDTPIYQVQLAASASLGHSFFTPILSDTDSQALKVRAGVGGLLYVNIYGFEQD